MAIREHGRWAVDKSLRTYLDIMAVAGGEIAARMVKRCERCSIVTVDDGVKTKEPLATLSTYRRSGGAGVFFGVNVVAEPGRLRVGDPVVLQDS